MSVEAKSATAAKHVGTFIRPSKPNKEGTIAGKKVTWLDKAPPVLAAVGFVAVIALGAGVALLGTAALAPIGIALLVTGAVLLTAAIVCGFAAFILANAPIPKQKLIKKQQTLTDNVGRFEQQIEQQIEQHRNSIEAMISEIKKDPDSEAAFGSQLSILQLPNAKTFISKNISKENLFNKSEAQLKKENTSLQTYQLKQLELIALLKNLNVE